MRPLTTVPTLAVLAASLLAAAAPAHAGALSGTIDFTASFSGNGITAVAATPAASGLTKPGTVSGTSVQFAVLQAEGTDFTDSLRATSRVDGSVGPGSSALGIRAEAWSGAVRLQNTGTAQSVLRINQTLLYSVSTSGTGTESISMSSALERLNGQGIWDIIGITAFGIGNDASNSACTPACSGVSGYAMAAGDTWTLRLHTTLRGNMTQPVPEPGGLALVAAALGALALVGRRRAGASPVLSAS